MLISGKTSFYGNLTSISSKNNEACVDAISGEKIVCKINEKLGDKLSSYLFKKQEICFEGKATWNVNNNWKIERFTLNSFFALEDPEEDLSEFFKPFEKHWKGSDYLDDLVEEL